MTYISTKTYGHELGLSVCFRQHKSRSHCQYLHGYALKIRLEFEADELDEKGWVVDFGGMKVFKSWLENTFDHKMLIAIDDPHIEILKALRLDSLADILVVPATGCESFAKMIYQRAKDWMSDHQYTPRVRLRLVEVCEHGANSAIYREDV